MHELRDIYYAEKQIVKTLPRMAKAASESSLQQAFEGHLRETEEHITRLEQVFEMMGASAKGEKCDGIEGILKEGKKFLDNGKKFDSDVLDAGLIASAQRVEHYEIAVYGTLRTFAEQIGEPGAVELLQQTLDEEKQADRKLTDIAVSSVNDKAAE